MRFEVPGIARMVGMSGLNEGKGVFGTHSAALVLTPHAHRGCGEWEPSIC
jgi:hypothetical protein